jgi:RNA polymerase sigma-70 factor (ECF subfamily)
MSASAAEVAAFVSALSPAQTELASAPDIAARLGRCLEDARGAWPSLGLAPLKFCAYLAERLGDEGTLEDLRAPDLYLACACVERVDGAQQLFEDGPFREASLGLSRINAPSDRIEDAKQNVRRQLLDGALADFAGRGDLRGWLRVTLTRQLLRLIGREQRQVALHTDQLIQKVGAAADPETEYLRNLYGDQFRQAFTDALTALSGRDRRLLRYRYVDELTVDDVGALLAVHRATAARQLARAGEVLQERTKELLRERLKVSSTELHSILRLVESQMHLSLQRLLE